MTDAAVYDDLRDRRIAASADGLLHEFNLAGVLESPDIHVADRLGTLANETDEQVLLAVALTVRAVRSGSVCLDLATQMVGDAEGHTKVVHVHVTGAASDDDARAGARKVAESQLVKCSWYGKDPYWGRIASELGSAGVGFDQRLLSISYGGVTVCRDGVAVDHDAPAVTEHMEQRHLEIACNLGLGSGRASVLTNDLTHAYVDENMGTS